MANNLYRAILAKIRRIPTLLLPRIRRVIFPAAPQQISIPFAPGRVYKTLYKNYKHDPRPLVFILSSNAYYTHGINIHYLGGQQTTMLRLILSMRQSGQPLTGLIMYRFMKQRTPIIPKLAYRLYFTKYLTGRLVSDGVSQVPLPNREKFTTEGFVFALNRAIRPRVVNRVRVTQAEADRMKNEMGIAVKEADRISIERGPK